MLSPASSVKLKQIANSLNELEGDGSLGRRIKAAQELSQALESITDGDRGVTRLCGGRGVASLLVALMDVCGEERDLTRNTILSSLARLIFFVNSNELLEDARVWALLLRMLYQRDETSVRHALTVMLRMSQDDACLHHLCQSRRLSSATSQLAASNNARIAELATEIAQNVSHAREAAEASGSSWSASEVGCPPNEGTVKTEAPSRAREGTVKTEAQIEAPSRALLFPVGAPS